MVFFITFIRALAAMIITNSHYTGVYPTDIIANGGLLGNVLFFAVSGYCLTNVKDSFGKWYFKRITRIYPVVIIITIFNIVLGLLRFDSVLGFAKLFIYPTNYHFIASILVLYIPFYLVMKVDFLKKRLPIVILGVFVLQLIVYLFLFDRSNYHIDVVFEPFIRFLYFIAMLIGAHVKQNDSKYRNNNKILNFILTFVFAVIYFASKMFFVKYSADAFVCQFQIVNQIVLIVLLYFIFVTVAGIDEKLEKLPKWIKGIIAFISGLTLEIYLVQDIVILYLNIGPFPVNWIILTSSIVVSAFVLNFISKKTILLLDKSINLVRKK